ncbi:hypothetical protein C882_4566 [Caenispirillum salinarum AK4]|uniref:Uncharacterized protein n=1 Tax=Caenispirillum salinarum AK4 TaxID=1238182 RepID=K9HNZ2_9PROT|nr:hypothetical protein [Caenispirillum salinarum]EKV30166.1 hypothetical protein C882_4566 [Caenispirillum salinarum AK4]
MRKVLMSMALTGLILGVALSTQVGLFVVQPRPAEAAGAAGGLTPVSAERAKPAETPAGMVYLMTRAADMRFLDSPDAICRRQFDRDNDACRGLVQGWVMRESRVLATLPYSEALWRMASGGG